MKVAVTGAAGFIGRHVLKQLASRGAETIAVIRPSQAHLPELPCARMVCLDIGQAPTDAYVLLDAPDVLIHLAWGGLPNYRSLHHFEVELPLHYRFLRNLVDAGLPNLLVTGTCFEYGMQAGCLSEDLLPWPHTPYGFAKDALRRQLEFLLQERTCAMTWARLFYVYGEGQSESALFSQLKAAVERGDPVFNMSGGEQLRDFLPADEAARCIVNLALTRKDLGVVNICSGTPISVRGLVERWIRENRWLIKLNLGHYPYPEYEPMAFWGDRSKLSEHLRREHSHES